VPKYQTVRGTRDILPGEVEAWQRVESLARHLFELYGFREIRTPIFESTDLFARGVGASTDIVRKEMYTFSPGEDSITLRPEMTASVVRAFIQHGLAHVPGADRLWYAGPMFRRERPQKGRQRQFHQFGVEALGSDDPYTDAETIEMVMAFLSRLGIAGLSLVMNSVGCPACRPVYRQALRDWLEPVLAKLCEDCHRRYEENPMRVFDCKVAGDRSLLADAPAVMEHLCEVCRVHFDSVLGHLSRLGIAYRIDPRLVRGLDYYVRTAFEIVAEEGLGAQNSLMGGGRYDGLVKELGGPDLPGFGWALGIERLLMLLGVGSDEGAPPALSLRSDVSLAYLGEEARTRAMRIAKELRAMEISVRIDPRPGKLGSQLKRADREGALFCLVLGDEEIKNDIYQLKDMRSGTQEPLPAGDWNQLLERLRHARQN
jgi:histidyl-tRNA synthetase